jgi:putative SOS response-associated peptidase YedK
MCGRYLLKRPPHEVADGFMVRSPAYPNFGPTYNAAPTDLMPAIRLNPATRLRSLDRLRWGLVPSWAKDLSGGARCINARAETIQTTRSFKDAFARRRALIPADGFYEWKTTGDKQPVFIGMADGSMLAFAGLWENWKNPGSGEWIRTFTIITTRANDLLAPIHERMPVILPQQAHAAWLGEADLAPDDLAGMLKPYPPELMTFWPVSRAVGSVRNNYPELAERIAS